MANAETRLAAVRKINNEINAFYFVGDYEIYRNINCAGLSFWSAMADKFAALDSLGRTDRWKSATHFAQDTIKDEPEAASWAVLQGTVHISHAL